jgi:CelD/BcsL family acetyltransferase involved in cellulose biosynthesis
VVLHHADVSPEDRTWFGPVPATNARRSLNDCAREGLSPDLLQQAAQQALRRGIVTEGRARRHRERAQTLRRSGGMTIRAYASPDAFKQAMSTFADMRRNVIVH